MSEVTIMEGIQTSIQSMSEFADVDVVINDWDILDQVGAKKQAPYVIIEISDDFESLQNTVTPNNTWNIKVTLIEAFVKKWKPTLDDLGTRRQAIIDKINDGSNRSAGGLDGTSINSIIAGGPVTEVTRRYPLDPGEAVPPDYLAQPIILEVEEF